MASVDLGKQKPNLTIMKKLVVMITAMLLGTVSSASAQTFKTDSVLLIKKHKSFFKDYVPEKNFSFKKATDEKTITVGEIPISYITISDEQMEVRSRGYFFNDGLKRGLVDLPLSFLLTNMHGDFGGLKIFFR